MSSYTALARFYDALTHDVPYNAIADFYEMLLRQNTDKVGTILDLACGTGTLTSLLAQRGYEMIGTDASADMLSVAAEKSWGLTQRPLYLNQPMENLDLYGTVDAAVCSLDGINYVKPQYLAEVFRRVRLFLNPGGLFIFDIHTPDKLRNLNGEIFLDETEDVFCVWRAEFFEEEAACRYGMDIFARDGRQWSRSREEHIEYAYEPAELVMMLTDAGFHNIKMYGDLVDRPPAANDQRLFFCAQRPGNDT